VGGGEGGGEGLHIGTPCNVYRTIRRATLDLSSQVIGAFSFSSGFVMSAAAKDGANSPAAGEAGWGLRNRQDDDCKSIQHSPLLNRHSPVIPCINTHKKTHALTQAHTHTHTHTHAHTCIHVYIHTNEHTRTYTYVHTYTHADIRKARNTCNQLFDNTTLLPGWQT